MDTEWIQYEQRLSIIEQKCFPEKIPYILLEFIYINKNSEVVKTTCEKLSIHAKFGSCLSKELLISIIHSHKKNTSDCNYVLKDTLLFHIPIQPEVLPSFLDYTFDCSSFMKSYPIIDDIVLAPSIFIFHPVNTLFFIYCEQETLAAKLKSALKSDHPQPNNNITKRVRIKLPISRSTRRTLEL